MSKEDAKEMIYQIGQFAVSHNKCSRKAVSYAAIRELQAFLWDYFSVDWEEAEESKK